MKTTSNILSEKEKNIAIYCELAKVAADIFENYIICEPGQYTAADIAKELTFDRETIKEYKQDYDGIYRNIEKVVIKNRRFKSSKFQFKQEYEPENDRREITFESFSCRVDGFSVFDVLRKAGAAWAVPTSKKVVFVREPESAAAVAGFDVPAAPVAKQLKNTVAADQLRPVMNYIYFDTARGVLVASDGHIMTVATAPAVAIANHDAAADGFLIANQLIKKGRVTIDANNMITNNGAAAVAGSGRFPHWFNIIPEHNASQAVNVGGHWPEIKKAVAKLAKFTDLQNSPVVFRGEMFNNKLYLSAVNYDGQQQHETVVLDENINYNFVIALDGENVAKIEKAEKLYFTDPSRAVSFVAAGVYSLAMPVLLDDNNFSYLESRYFKAPTDGARVDVLKGIISEPQDTTNEAAAVAIESQDTNETTNESEPAPVAIAASAADDIESQDTNETTNESEPAPAAVVPCPVADDVRENMEKYATLYLYKQKYTDNEIFAAARALKKSGFLPVGDYFETLRGVRVAKIAKKYDFKTGRVLSVAVEFLTIETSEPENAAPVADDIESQDTTNDDAPAVIVADVETESEPESESEPATAADGLQLISINETTGEIIWSRAGDDTTNESEPAAVLAANFAARARRWFAVAAAVLALFIVGATTNESGAPSSLPMVTPQDTARAIVATVADVETESEPQDTATAAPVLVPQGTNESATTPAKASHRTPRARRAAKLAPVAIVASADTLTTDTTTAAPVAIVASAADDIESQDTTNDDDAPAVIVADDENEPESEPATVADDDTNDDGNGTTTTGNGATTGTTTAPAPVVVVIVYGVPVPVCLPTL